MIAYVLLLLNLPRMTSAMRGIFNYPVFRGSVPLCALALSYFWTPAELEQQSCCSDPSSILFTISLILSERLSSLRDKLDIYRLSEQIVEVTDPGFGAPTVGCMCIY